MIRIVAFFSVLLTSAGFITACGTTPGGVYQQTNPQFQVRPGQGQYVRPEWQNTAPTPRIPQPDICRSRLYAGLLGQHEGAIYIAGLPGLKRIVKPAFIEDSDMEQISGIDPDPILVEVLDYLPDQSLYAPAIRTVSDRLSLGPENRSRITLELDVDGYVQDIRCG